MRQSGLCYALFEGSARKGCNLPNYKSIFSNFVENGHHCVTRQNFELDFDT